MDCIFALDAGGTFLKYALMTDAGEPVPGSLEQTAVNSAGEREPLMRAFEATGRAAFARAAENGYALRKISVSFPGPFDYEQGFSRMEHKYKALKGVPIAPLLRGGAEDTDVVFLHDSTAFLLGEYAKGAAAGYRRPAGLMLGTGLGFCSMEDGRVMVGWDQRPRLSLWNMPYRGGICEDYVSRRTILKAYGAEPGADVKEIAQRAFAGERKALDVFASLTESMIDILTPALRRVEADSLVIGGQIAKSSALFLPALQDGLGLPVHQARLIENGALYGAWYYAQNGKERCVTAADAILSF